jgi:hypothetical protein
MPLTRTVTGSRSSTYARTTALRAIETPRFPTVVSSQITLRKKRVRLAEVIEEAVESMRPTIESRGLTLRVEVAREPIFVDAEFCTT